MISQFEVKVGYQKRGKYFCAKGVCVGKSMSDAVEKVEETFAQDPEISILTVEVTDTLEAFYEISDEEVV